MSNDLRAAAQTPLPCPFCGGAPELPVRTYYVRCSECLAEGPYERGPHEVAPTEAIAAWNRRAALAEPVQEPVFLWGKAIGVEQKCGCLVCGIGADGKAYGYVCPRSDCPTRVTCGGAA